MHCYSNQNKSKSETACVQKKGSSSSTSTYQPKQTYKFASIVQQKHGLLNLTQKKEQPVSSNTTNLPTHLKQRAESASGVSLSDVSVHYNSPNPEKAGALAYTQGSDIYVGPGNEHTLGHETWHVVQQKQGRVAATKNENGQLINDNIALEKEADLFGSGASIQMQKPIQGFRGIFQKIAQFCKYKFTSKRNLEEHYEKHGEEMGIKSEHDYAKFASGLVNDTSKRVLHEERKDGAWVHYDPKTTEIVITDSSWNIITYFDNASWGYYQRQFE